MIRPLMALPFLGISLLFLAIANAFSDLAAWIDCKPCAGCGGLHD